MEENTLISSDDKKKAAAGGKLKSGKKELKPKALGKLSKPEIHFSASLHGKIEDPKARISVSGPTVKGKIKAKMSGKDIKVKEVQLPGKIIKMKDLISLPCKDPIHDVKEIPRFEIYRGKK